MWLDNKSEGQSSFFASLWRRHCISYYNEMGRQLILSVSRNVESFFIRFVLPRLYSFLFSLRPAGSVSLTTGDKSESAVTKILAIFYTYILNTCPVVVVIKRYRPLWFPSQLIQIDFWNSPEFWSSDTSRGKLLVYSHV